MRFSYLEYNCIDVEWSQCARNRWEYSCRPRLLFQGAPPSYVGASTNSDFAGLSDYEAPLAFEALPGGPQVRRVSLTQGQTASHKSPYTPWPRYDGLRGRWTRPPSAIW